MKPLRWMLMLGFVASPVLASQTGLASSIVEVTPQDLSELHAEPVHASGHAGLTGGDSPRERSSALFASSDGRLSVAVSWSDRPEIERGPAPADEFVYLLDGEVEIAALTGGTQVFRPGDAFVVPHGFSGQWRQLSPVRKVVVSYAAAPSADPAATESSEAVVGVGRRLLDGAEWTPVQEAPFARLTSGNQPKSRSAVAFTSADGRLVVDVSSYEVMSLATFEWPIDEFMVFLEGEVEIRDAAGQGGVYGPGDSIATPKGWTGTWKQASPLTKIAVSYDSSL